MSDEFRHRHHYVPVWYQRGFLAEGQTGFQVLDKRPEMFRDKTGKVRGQARSILADRSPESFFFENDLYTIRWLGREDDVIERMLFGAIDAHGAIATRAWLDEDLDVIHQTYGQVYEFMDALRLRTPRGLRYVRNLMESRGLRLENKTDVMVAMQRLRRMHCLMWIEGTLEIVNADQSPTKFLFTDNPVTLYNQFVFPGDPAVPAGMDPHLHWLGTQTLWPFDRDRLFILTHTEFALSPGPNKARKDRTNARYQDSNTGWYMYDDCLRGRSLTEQQVLAVNYIMKTRADRYVAGRSEEDLFPERRLKSTRWDTLAAGLMPPIRKLKRQNGYTMLQTKEGKWHFQDQFGRKPKNRAEYAREVERAERIHADLQRILAKHDAERRAKEAKGD